MNKRMKKKYRDAQFRQGLKEAGLLHRCPRQYHKWVHKTFYLRRRFSNKMEHTFVSVFIRSIHCYPTHRTTEMARKYLLLLKHMTIDELLKRSGCL